jgi:hypothetical protein
MLAILRSCRSPSISSVHHCKYSPSSGIYNLLPFSDSSGSQGDDLRTLASESLLRITKKHISLGPYFQIYQIVLFEHLAKNLPFHHTSEM